MGALGTGCLICRAGFFSASSPSCLERSAFMDWKGGLETATVRSCYGNHGDQPAIPQATQNPTSLWSAFHSDRQP